MSGRRSIGWQITYTYCRECAPDGLRDSYGPMREGDDHGIPYVCDVCGLDLTPCNHEWGEWNPWFQGGEWRSCKHDACDEIERRDTADAS